MIQITGSDDKTDMFIYFSAKLFRYFKNRNHFLKKTLAPF